MHSHARRKIETSHMFSFLDVNNLAELVPEQIRILLWKAIFYFYDKGLLQLL